MSIDGEKTVLVTPPFGVSAEIGVEMGEAMDLNFGLLL
jgi:hypothetical protein